MNTKQVDIKEFLGSNFLLENEIAIELYHGFAKEMPIIDYHCHLPPEDLALDRHFKSITEIWLEGDHYKWRAMRANGVSERFITGNASDKDKFIHWATTVPYTLRNPLYHWTHLELRRYFDINEILNEHSAERIFEDANSQLNTAAFTARNILRKMNVEVVCTTDAPAHSLQSHIRLKSEFEVKVLPTFRPDKAYAVEDVPAYLKYIEQLSEVSETPIDSLDSLLEALSKRIDFFKEQGCKLADHGLERLYYEKTTYAEAQGIFLKVMGGNALINEESEKFKYVVLLELCKLYNKQGWTQQFHLGALRNTNSRMMDTLGPDTGFDSIGDFGQAESLAGFLNQLDSSNELAKTIIYNLNPGDNEVIATMIGNFNDGSIPG